MVVEKGCSYIVSGVVWVLARGFKTFSVVVNGCREFYIVLGVLEVLRGFQWL